MPDTPNDTFDAQYTDAPGLFPRATTYPDMALANEGGAVIARGSARLGMDGSSKLRTTGEEQD